MTKSKNNTQIQVKQKYCETKNILKKENSYLLNKRLTFILWLGLISFSLMGFSSTSFSKEDEKPINPVNEISKSTEPTLKPKELPLDNVLIKLWQAIDFIIEVTVIFKNGDKTPYLIEPRGVITTNSPIFEWTQVPEATSYRIYINNKPIGRTLEPKFVLSELEQVLSYGTYTWEVEVLKGDSEKGEFSHQARFRIISKEEESQIEDKLQSAKELLISYYLLTGSIYLKHQFFKEAIVNFKEAIEVNPNNPHPYLGLASAYHGVGKNKEKEDEAKKAISLFIQAIELNPDNTNLHLGLAYTYELIGKTEEEAEEEEERRKAEEILRK